MENPEFWKNKEKAIKISQELALLQQEISQFEAIKTEEELKKAEWRFFLSGKYDKGNAILEIFAGAGGQDAQDWVTMLCRMYQRYCQKQGWQTKILHQSFGQSGGPEGRIGTKEVSLEIIGHYAYGFLKGERGVHRLVRLSPFSAKQLRHTSFAKVEVLPLLKENDLAEIVIKPEELKIETFRASGPGGQYVNRRETAVRLTHLPTKISVSCQTERLQGANRKKAMTMLKTKLYQLKEAEREKEIGKIKEKGVKAEWGNQIRSYILQPYHLVKDVRTGIETSDVEGVLDGNLDKFIEAEIKMKK